MRLTNIRVPRLLSTDWKSSLIKVITLANHKLHGQSSEPIKSRVHVADTKRGKTCASESRLVLVFFLIGRETGDNFKPIAKLSKAKPTQTRITFARLVKTDLSIKRFSLPVQVVPVQHKSEPRCKTIVVTS